jgi:hypothetical protein
VCGVCVWCGVCVHVSKYPPPFFILGSHDIPSSRCVLKNLNMEFNSVGLVVCYVYVCFEIERERDIESDEVVCSSIFIISHFSVSL